MFSKPRPTPPQDAQQDAQEKPAPTKPAIIVKVIRENLEVEMQLQHTSQHTSDPLFEDIMAALKEKGVVYGIREDNIRHLCTQPTYNQILVVAHGLAPSVGEDGNVNMLVKTHRDLKPKIKEDGTADFKDLGFIENVHAGTVLCEIYPPKQGENGMDVLGNTKPGLFGKEAIIPAGMNTVVEDREDGVKLLKAACDGNVEYKQGFINIQDVLRINENVCNATGDIDFIGDVVIAGDVQSGFNVKSGGSVQVKGNVEGARIDAKGDITINGGMNGMDRGVLIAEGDVRCKYIQSSLIKTGGNLISDAMMYCTVECGGNMELTGKKAALIGGKTTVSGSLNVKTIGTFSHANTEVVMCTAGMQKKKEAEAVAAHIKDMDSEITKLIQITAHYNAIAGKIQLNAEQQKALEAVKNSYTQAIQRRKEAQEKLDEIKKEQLEADSANTSFILCKDRVHTGTRISFGPLTYVVTASFVNSRIHLVNGEITISPQ